VKFFFLLTFAAAVPAIVSGGIAERARFNSQLAATFLLVALVYPFFEGIAWNQRFGVQGLDESGIWRRVSRLCRFGRGACRGRVDRPDGGAAAWPASRPLHEEGTISGHPPSSIPFLALGAWVLSVGWFGFNVMSAQTIDKISGLVAVNSLLAMAGGTLAAFVAGRNDPGFVHNGPLAGLVAICAGSDVMHPIGALATGIVAGGLFVLMFTLTQNRWKIDDVLGVWPLHGVCGVWGGIAAGIFGSKALGGLGGVAFGSQLVGTLAGVLVAVVGGLIVYGSLRLAIGLRLDPEEEQNGADLTIHKISATPSGDASW
jgi:Amt family ammonium transporter